VLAKFQKIHSGVHQGQAETEVWMCFQCVFGWFSVGFWGPIVLAEFRRNSRLGAKRWPNQLSRAKGKKCILAAASEQVAQHLSVFILSECDSENSHKYGYISWHFKFSRGNIFERFAVNLLWRSVNKRPIKCAKSIA